MDSSRGKITRQFRSVCQLLIFQFIVLLTVNASPRIKAPSSGQLIKVISAIKSDENFSHRNKTSELTKDINFPSRFGSGATQIENETNDYDSRGSQAAIGDHSIADALAIQNQLDTSESMSEPLIEGK